ncbi:MAG: response regulator, partial [Clostridia bacterium]|nr:response regulator [Clostridia bacterium]
MNIALCDDEVVETRRIAAMIEDYALRKDYDIHCKQFNKGSELLKAPKFDLYILDYKMDEMNGVEVAAALKEKYARGVTICYLTNYESAAGEVINHQIYAD